MAAALADRVSVDVRADRRAMAAWGALVIAGVVVGGAITSRDPRLHTNAAPFHGRWELVVRPSALLAIVAAVLVVAAGPRVADGLRWGRLLVAAPIVSLISSFALAATVGGHGFVAPLTTRYEYLSAVPAVGAPGDFLRNFTASLPSFPTHVKGHPPGLVLVLWFLERIGLGSPVFAAVVVVAVGASAVAAVLLVVRDVGGEPAARRVAPFLVLAPAAVWMATSGDAFFTGVGAWAVACTVLATSTATVAATRRWTVVAGLAWAAALLSSYGLVLLAPVALAVAWRRQRVVVVAATGAVALLVLLVIGVGTGFWWPLGLAATRRAYDAGFAADRSAGVFVWLNVAAVAVAAGPVVAVAFRRARGMVAYVSGGAVAGLVLADLSLLSKGEVERIWLPWVPWLLVATAAVPVLQRRHWLAAQAATALSMQFVLRSPW